MKNLSLILAFLITGIGSALGQSKTVTNYLDQLYATWDSTYSNYSVSHVTGDSAAGVQLIKNVPVQDNSSEALSTLELEQAVKYQEAQVLKGDIGLEATLSYAYNLDPGIGYDDNLFYDQKFRAGIGMDLLSGGYFSNHNAAKIKMNELEMMKMGASEEFKKQDKYLKWHNIIYQFNLKKLEVLRSREKLALERVEVAQKLNLLKHVSQKELIEAISSEAEINSMLHIYENYNQQLSSEIKVKNESLTEYPLFDIDYSYSYKLLTSEEPDSLTALMLENIKLDKKAIHDLRLRPYVAYNFFDLVSADPSFRSYLSVGVTFAAPLNFNSGNKSRLKEAQSELAKSPTAQQPEIQNDVLSAFYEFRYKLKQFSNLYHKRQMYEELLRREQVKHDISPTAFHPMDALKLMDNLMQIDIELIDTKQQMYLKILDIYTDLPYTKANKLIHPITFDDSKTNNHKHSNSIYIWSSSVEKYGAKVIAHYLELNNINNAVISFNSKSNAQKITLDLINMLTKKNITVELMLGKNSLIHGGFTSYMEKIGGAINWSKIKAIHLDVEPHTQKDWRENKASYLSKYHQLLQESNAFCDRKKIELNVSIPTHYPQEDIKKIFNTVDNVYFMCYENVKTDFIVRKTNLYIPEKTHIALRTNDFANRLEIEQKFDEIDQLMKTSGFIIHDFGSLLEFDKNSINK